MTAIRKEVKKAEKLVGQGKLQSALNLYENILRKDPNDHALHNVVGDLYVRSGEPKGAVPHFQKSAELLENQGFRTKAIAVLRKAYRQAPSNSEIVETLAKLLKQEGLLADARQILIELARNRHQVGQHKEARKLYKKVLEIDPNHVQALLKIGEIAAQEGNIDEECDAYCAIAAHLTNSARFEEALELVEEAYKSAPQHKELSRIYADLLRRTGQHEQAQKVLTSSRRAHGADVETLVSLSELALERHDLAAAQELFNQARNIDEESERVLLLGSGIATLAGDYDVALGYLRPLIQKVLDTKQGGPVIRTLEEIVQRHPGHLPTLKKLDTVYAYLKDQTSRARILIGISKAHEKAGDFQLAIEAAEEAQKVEPDKLAHKKRIEHLYTQSSGAAIFGAEESQTLEPDDLPESLDLELEGEEKDSSDSFQVGEIEEEEISFLEVDEVPGGEIVVEEEPEEEEYSGKTNPHVQRTLIEVGVFLRYGLTTKAKERLEEAKRIDKHDPEIYEKLADIFVEEKNRTAALKNLAEAAACWERRDNPERAEAAKARIEELQVSETAAEPVQDISFSAEEFSGFTVDHSPDSHTTVEPDFPEAGHGPTAFKEDTSDHTPVIDPLAARISEAEYYLEQNFTSAANHLLSMLKDQYPDHERIAELWLKLEKQTEASIDTNDVEKELDDFFSPLESTPDDFSDELADPDSIEEEISHEDFVAAVKAEMAAEQKRKQEKEKPQTVPELQEEEKEEEEEEEEEEFLLDVVLEEDNIAESEAAASQFIETESLEVDQLQDKGITEDSSEEEMEPFSAVAPKQSTFDDSPLKDIADILEEDLFAVHSAAERRLNRMSQPGRLITAERILGHTKEMPLSEAEANADKHFEMGIAYMETGLYEEAINEFQISAEDPVFFQRSCLQLGICFLSKGMHSTAVEWLQRGIGGGGDENIMADSLHQLAIIYQIQGQTEAFRHAVEQLESLDDNHPGLATLKAIL